MIKVLTVIYYDRTGKVQAMGAETISESVYETAEVEGWLKSERLDFSFWNGLKLSDNIGSHFFFFFFQVKFKSIRAEPHVRPYNFVDYLRLLVPYTWPLKTIPCTVEGTPMVIIPPHSPAWKHRLGMCLCGEQGSLVSLLYCVVHLFVFVF